MIKAFKSLFGFLTIIPVGMPRDLERVAANMYLFPVVGGVLGLIAGLFLSLSIDVLPFTVSAAASFFLMLGLTGFHHLDGLLDFGDGLLYRGDKRRRIEILHDANTGAGGFGLGSFVIVIGVVSTYENILKGGNPITFFIVSDSVAKLSMVLTAGFGNAAFDGMGSVFVERLKKDRWQLLASTALTCVVLVLSLGNIGLGLIILPLLASLSIVWVGNRLIGGVSGDFFGAVSEFTRIFSMVVMIWML